jgi:chaperone BCS1
MAISEALGGIVDGNPYFNAGFGLTLLAGGLALAKRTAIVGMQQLRRASTVTLEVTSKDQSYPWVLSWINAQVLLSFLSSLRDNITSDSNE